MRQTHRRSRQRGRGWIDGRLRTGAGNDECVYPSFLHAGMQIRGARQASAKAALKNDHILLGNHQLRLERIPGLPVSISSARRLSAPQKCSKKTDHLRMASSSAVLCIHYDSTRGTRGRADAVDIGDDRTGPRDLSGCHQAVLQIDDDMRCPARHDATITAMTQFLKSRI